MPSLKLYTARQDADQNNDNYKGIKLEEDQTRGPFVPFKPVLLFFPNTVALEALNEDGVWESLLPSQESGDSDDQRFYITQPRKNHVVLVSSTPASALAPVPDYFKDLLSQQLQIVIDNIQSTSLKNAPKHSSLLASAPTGPTISTGPIGPAVREPANELDLYKDRLATSYVQHEHFLQAVPAADIEKDELRRALRIAANIPGNNENKHQHPTLMKMLNSFLTTAQQANNIVGPNRIVEMELGNGTFTNYPDTPTLSGKKPDCVLYVDSDDKSSRFIKTFVELTMKHPIDDMHIGKGIHYNELILQVQPERQSVISMVTNLKQIVFVQSFRSKGIEISTGVITKRIGITKSLHRMLTILCDLTSDYTGYTPLAVNIPSCGRFKSFSFLGSGATSICFLSGGLIIKKFFSREFYEQECLIYAHIKDKQTNEHKQKWPVSHFMEWVGQDSLNNVLAFRGVGKPIPKQMYASKKLILSMVDCLRELESLNIVHRDITRRHFMFREDLKSHVLLIDLGSAVVKSKKKVAYRGSAYLAANEALQSVADGKTYLPRFQHDWESFIKLLLIQFRYATYSHLRSLPNTDPRDFQQIKDYWVKVEEVLNQNNRDNALANRSPNPYVLLLQSCREQNTTLDSLLSHLQPLLSTFNEEAQISPYDTI